MKRKAQINFEFLAAASLYLITLGIILTSGSNIIPSYQGEAERASLNMETRTLTNQMLTENGSHNTGTDWENHVEDIETVGIANEFLQLNRSKINALSTVGDASDGNLNYSRFKNITDVENQYRFRFTWMPTVDTNRSFERGSPPTNPNINEPTHDLYNNSDKEVHYGKETLKNKQHYFLVTSHNGVYNTTYYSDSWDFSSSDPRGVDDPVDNYNIESFQNRLNEPGALIIISERIKTFGASIESDTTTIKINRFAELENEPLRMEVWAW